MGTPSDQKKVKELVRTSFRNEDVQCLSLVRVSSRICKWNESTF